MADFQELVDELERSYREAQERLSDPAVYNDHREAAEVGRRVKELEGPAKLAQVAVVARRFEVVADRAPLLRQLVRAFEVLQAPTDLRSLAVVVVNGRVRQTLLGLLVGALELVDQLLEISHGARLARGRSGDRRP